MAGLLFCMFCLGFVCCLDLHYCAPTSTTTQATTAT